jgi:methylase of polypeptide subunit release factors
MLTLPDGRQAAFLSESGAPTPGTFTRVDDTVAADTALRMLQDGDTLLWEGDYRNGRELLGALKRRLKRSARPPLGDDLAARWRAERAATRETAELLGALVVLVNPDGSVALRQAPETSEAVELAWGASPDHRLIALNALQGALSAAEWTRKGIEVRGLSGRLTPSYGVFSPTRSVYVDLVSRLDVSGKSVLDVGCGTGVLAFVLLQAGAREAIGTDLDDRAICCAQMNAEKLGLQDRFTATQADLFPAEARADWVIFNAPWIPEVPRTRLDRTVFDEGGEAVHRFLKTVQDHLAPGGRAALVLSDLPERVGLRADGAIEEMAEAAGLNIAEIHDAPASHRRAKDTTDPLHSARAAERVRLFVLEAG